MPEEMTCFACEQEPTQQCPRCGRPYCDDHGEDVCDACLEPASGLPSFTLYRGSLLALLIGTALAVWLILQPPGSNGNTAAAPLVITPTELPIVQQTPTLPAGATVTTTTTTPTTPVVGDTPLPTTTTAPVQETPATSASTTTYTVQSGDTLSEICANLSSLSAADCVTQTLTLNSISDPTTIRVGETLTIPLR